MVFLNEIAVFPCDVGVCMIRAHSPRHKLISARRAVSRQPEPGRVSLVHSLLSGVVDCVVSNDSVGFCGLLIRLGRAEIPRTGRDSKTLILRDE